MGDIKVLIIESESGWGQKVDDTKLFKSEQKALEFCKDYNTEHNQPNDDGTTPDWYMYARPEGERFRFGMLMWTEAEWAERQLVLAEKDAALDPNRMDANIMKNGTYVGMVHNVSKEEMNRICEWIRTGPWKLRVDWHYAGGRIIVKTLDDPQQVLNLLPFTQPA